MNRPIQRNSPNLGARVAGLVGIAAAPDFTDWGRTAEDKVRLSAGETVFDENPYGPEPTPMHPDFFTDGQALRRLAGEIPIDCPVRLLHGQDDGDVTRRDAAFARAGEASNAGAAALHHTIADDLGQ